MNITRLIQTLKDNNSIMNKNLFSKLNHEIRTPCIAISELASCLSPEKSLNLSIKNNSTQLSSKFLNDISQTNESISILSDIIISSTNQVNDYVNGLNNINLIRYEINISEIAQWAFLALKSIIHSSGKTSEIFPYLEINQELQEKKIKTDIMKLKSVLLELIKNSVYYTTNGNISIHVDFEIMSSTNKSLDKLIGVEIPSKERVVSIFIKDTGIGFSKMKISNLQNELMFQEQDDLKLKNFSKYGMLSLGLYIINHYCSKMEIKLNVLSKERKGTISSLNINNLIVEKSSKMFSSKLIMKSNTPLKLMQAIKFKSIESNKQVISFFEQSTTTQDGTNFEIPKRKHSFLNKNKFISDSSEMHNLLELPKKFDATSYSSDMEENIKGESFQDKLSNMSQKVLIPINKIKIDKSTVNLPHTDKRSKILGSQLNLISHSPTRSKSEYQVIKKNKPILKKSKLTVIQRNSSEDDSSSSEKENTKNETKSDFDTLFNFKEHFIRENIILIADDDSYCRNSLKRLVTQVLMKNDKLDCYSVITLTDGIDVINYFLYSYYKKLRIKLLFTDENMKFLNGSESIKILNSINSKVNYFAFKSIIVTALNEVNASSSLCNRVVNKPINYSLVEEILKNSKII